MSVGSTEPPSPPPTDTGLEEIRRVDEVCDRFEADWKAGVRGDVQGYLDAVPETVRPRLQRELLTLADELRRRDEGRDDAVAGPPPPGEVLGDYLILEVLGRGGMGCVYKALHQRMRRVVALKVPACEGRDARLLARRFLREVRLVARLVHPNVVTAYDAGEDRGRAYLALEYVDGTDLARHVREHGPLGPLEAIDAAEQAALGLAAAHRLGIIHRDVKPSNLILAADGVVKLLDLGLARAGPTAGASTGSAPPSTELTVGGVLMGTVDYMSPEQALDIRRADARTDVYGLGCTLFHLLTGRPPYGGATLMERLVAHREAPVPSPRAVRPDVPESLDALVRSMLAKAPSGRPASMDAVIAALRDARATLEAPSVRRAGRRKWLAVGALTALIAPLALLVALRPSDRRPPEGRPPAPAAPAPAPAVPADPSAATRRVAVQTLRLGGSIELWDVGKVVAAERLPAGPFRLKWVDLQRHQRDDPRSAVPVGDAELGLFEGLEELDHLHLGGTQVTDAGLARLRSITGLKHLYLPYTPITDRGLAWLADLPQLEQVVLMNTAITDEGADALARCRSLRYLNLDATKVTDAALARLRPLQGLLHLDLDDTAVGDAGLAALRAFPHLERVSLARTRVSDAGLAVLADLPALHELSLEGNAGVSDGGLAQLERLTRLTELDVESTSLSDAGLRRLRAALPGCRIRPEPR